MATTPPIPEPRPEAPSAPSSTTPAAGATAPSAGRVDGVPAPTRPADVVGLNWLLENFLADTPFAEAVVLTSRDGLVLAGAGVHPDKAQHAAAVASSLHGSGAGAGTIRPPYQDEVEQIVVQLRRQYFMLMTTNVSMATHHGMPGGRTVGTFLGVLAAGDADIGVIGTKTKALINSLTEHLVTRVRGTGDTGHGNAR